ncbi:hypothetical protein [uncultured Draconibacterium sp.]|uniref:hypothetical protein n=1 Tax=uncultured Draconibacterium sp. TaxID=1573823 RepID=UPI002AA65363|nr:hypothetical protein [uncultured Draconibacterium sp.]
MDNKIIRDVKIALNNIHSDYFEMPVVSLNGENLIIDNDDLKNYERRFMIEFASQYGKLIDTDLDNIYNGTKKDFEIPKKYMWSEAPDLKVRETFQKLNEKDDSETMLNYITTYPDFLIHKHQTDKTPNNQKLIIEAKTGLSKSRIEFLKDIFHINIYADKYDFQNNVLLLIHLPKYKWTEYLEEYYKCRYFLCRKEKISNIYVIFKETYNSDIEVIKFDKLINGFYNKKSPTHTKT